MFSQNPRSDQFKLSFPVTFFVDEISDKYNEIFQQKPYIFDSIQHILYESIKSFDSPEFGYSLQQQESINGDNAGRATQLIPKENMGKIAEKTFLINFRHCDGYLTYFLMLEHFFYRYKLGKGADRKHFGTIILELTLPNGITVCRIKYHRCYLIGVPALSLDYSNPARDESTFGCTFGYDKFETSFDLPTLKTK